MSMLPVLNGHIVNGKRVGLDTGESKTKQKIGTEHDINKLIAKYKKTGEFPSTLDEVGKYVDTSNIGDYQDCQLRILNAYENWLKYPSTIRRRFNNNIGDFATFLGSLNDPNNMALAVELGLAIAQKPPIPAVKPEDKDGDKK